MRVEHYEFEFVVAQITFEERHIPRAAGFHWNPARKRWITEDPRAALSIPPQYLAPSAKKALGLGADTILVPEGRDMIPFQEDGVMFALGRRDTLIADQPGLGKGHPVTTRLVTESGLTPLGSIKVGDKVIGSYGQPIRVTGVFDRGVIPVYKVVFSDGATVMCDGDHLWMVEDQVTMEWLVLETRVLLARVAEGHKFKIPHAPVYAGQWRSAQVSAAVAGIDCADTACPKSPRNVRKGIAYSDIFRFDPRDYVHTSWSQRIEFLRGVVRRKAWVEKTTGALQLDIIKSDKNMPLVQAVTDIVRSLGGLVYRENRYRRVRLTIYLPVGTKRLVLSISKDGETPRYRFKTATATVPNRLITSISPAGQDHVRCISVDSSDHLYMVEGYVLTHNTVQAIGFANSLTNVKSGLIVPPASLKENWLKEWKGTETYQGWSTQTNLSIDIAEGSHFPESDVVIINYDLLSRHEKRIKSQSWDFGVFDEAHYLKNRDAKRTKQTLGGAIRVKPEKGPYRREIIKPIHISRRLFLTGTPLSKKTPIDLWTLAQACDPAGIGADYDQFAYRYCGAYTDSFGKLQMGTAQNLEELNERLKASFMIRRLKADVLKDLPQKTRQIIPLPADGLKAKMQEEKDSLLNLLDAYEQMIGIQKNMSEKELVEAVLSVSPKTWEKYAEGADAGLPMDMPLNRLANARKELAVAKLPMVIEYVDNLLDAGEKVVVFGYHQAVIEGLMEAFPGAPAIYGKTPNGKRQEQVDRFQNYTGAVPFIGQYTAAGVGYTLTEASQWVGAEMTWIPTDLLQAEDRIHRIGQHDPCWMHHLVVEGSLDDTFVMNLIEKMIVIERALD